MYNLTVDDAHTFFVGEQAWLVHNTCLPDLGQKLEYLFGNATGRLHNIIRSADLERQLNSIGIFDNPAGREYLTEVLNSAYSSTDNIIEIAPNGYVLRETLLSGPNGFLKMTTIWDSNKLVTIILRS
jgi:hypothetical protein